MDRFEIQERKRQAQRRLAAQRRRAGALRGRVVAISLICFALLWGVVFMQMATGNDPVLGDSSSASAASRHRADRPRAAPEVAGPEAVEPLEPQTVEPEAVEEEPIEEEFLGAEVEPEPAPVITSQS